jgi:hypothetical protein
MFFKKRNGTLKYLRRNMVLQSQLKKWKNGASETAAIGQPKNREYTKMNHDDRRGLNASKDACSTGACKKKDMMGQHPTPAPTASPHPAKLLGSRSRASRHRQHQREAKSIKINRI